MKLTAKPSTPSSDGDRFRLNLSQGESIRFSIVWPSLYVEIGNEIVICDIVQAKAMRDWLTQRLEEKGRGMT